MKAALTRQFVVFVVLLEVGGCTSLRRHWPFEHLLPPATSSYERRHRPAPSTTPEESSTTEVEEGPEKRKETIPVANVPTPAAQAPIRTTSVTLEDNDADHIQAQALLDDADHRLAHIDRSKLTGENADAYDQANILANAARKAMVQHDYLAASGLARKAVLVTGQVVSRTSSPR